MARASISKLLSLLLLGLVALRAPAEVVFHEPGHRDLQFGGEGGGRGGGRFGGYGGRGGEPGRYTGSGGECEMQMQLTDSQILTRVTNQCPCDGAWQDRRNYMDCVTPIINRWYENGLITGSKAVHYWESYFKYVVYIRRMCGFIGYDNGCDPSWTC